MRTFHYLVALATSTTKDYSHRVRTSARRHYTEKALNDILLLKEIKF